MFGVSVSHERTPLFLFILSPRELRTENVELRVQLLKLHDGSIRQVSETVGVLQKSVADLVQELRLQRGGGGSSGVGGGCCVAWVRILASVLSIGPCAFPYHLCVLRATASRR